MGLFPVRRPAASHEPERPLGPTESAQRRDDVRPGIVLAEPDAYLAFLIHLNLPTAHVIEAGLDADLREAVAGEPDLLIVNLDGPRAVDVLALRGRSKILGIVDGRRASRTAVPEVDGVLVRPFLPTELHRAVRRALGYPEDAETLQDSRLDRARFWIAIARLGAVAIAGLQQVATSGRVFLFGIAFAYAVGRLAMKRPGRVYLAGDVVIASTFIALTGGPSSPYTPYGLVCAIAVGLSLGSKAGALAGAAIAGSSLHLVIKGIVGGSLSGQHVVAWLGFFSLGGVAGGFASRVLRLSAQQGAGVLSEANRVLSALYRLARTMPGGLEVGTVAQAAIDEIRDTLRAPAAALLVGEAGTFATAASFGIAAPEDLVLTRDGSRIGGALEGPARVARRESMTPPTAAALGAHECWLVAPLQRGHLVFGALLAACPDHERHRENRILIQQLADDTAVAVENARLFGRVRELSADEERRLLARELHDGVAQALTHLRFELDFMGRQDSISEQTIRQETDRLARVVDRALADVRSMILGLRSQISPDGLAASIREYLRDLSGLGGPEIIFRARGEGRLPADVEAEAFRIAQEGVSNALRHARATTVSVHLDVADGLRLSIQDDGVGLGDGSPIDGGGGVGLPAMKERAQKIGAMLDVRGGLAGGTVIDLHWTPEWSRGGPTDR